MVVEIPEAMSFQLMTAWQASKAGPGTTGIACINSGRSFVGCELDEGYTNAARKRLAAHQAQPRMFDAPKEKVEQQARMFDTEV